MVSLFSVRGQATECLAELVGARGGPMVASDAFEAGDDIFYLHACHQPADALQIAIASAIKDHIVQSVVVRYVEFYSLTTCTACIVYIVFHIFMIVYLM